MMATVDSNVTDSTQGDDNYVIDLTEFGGGTITLLGVTTTDSDDFFLRVLMSTPSMNIWGQSTT